MSGDTQNKVTLGNFFSGSGCWELAGMLCGATPIWESEYDVRRLTPTECARLQGFPPDWCADVPHSDSAEYKLWGNGIALPSILPMMQNAVRIVKEWKNDKCERNDNSAV